MRNIIQRVHVHPAYSKVYSWSKLITITGGAQAMVQAAALVCGILVIRLLPTQEYALYTLANTMLGTMTLLADGGISAGVMSLGGKVWSDKKELGVILSTGLQLRRKFAVVSLLIAVPILLYLLLYHGATPLMAVLVALSLVPAFFAALSDSLLEIAPKLHQDIKPLQKNQILVGLSRLGLSALLLFAFPWAFIAIIASGLPRAYGNIRLKKIAGKFAEKQAPDKEAEKKILKVVKRVLPNAVYYCFVSQISIWLISIFGTTTAIAQVGALGRLGVVTSLFVTMLTTLVVPRFARLAEEKKLLMQHFSRILVILLALCIAIIGFTALFPTQLLFIIGKQYANLHNELILSITVSCLGLVISVVNALCMARGYIISPVFNIGIHVLAQIILIVSLNLSTARNVLIFSIFDNSTIVLMLLVNFVYYVSRIRAGSRESAG